jgi:hypothetical protein
MAADCRPPPESSTIGAARKSAEGPAVKSGRRARPTLFSVAKTIWNLHPKIETPQELKPRFASASRHCLPAAYPFATWKTMPPRSAPLSIAGIVLLAIAAEGLLTLMDAMIKVLFTALPHVRDRLSALRLRHGGRRRQRDVDALGLADP